MHLRTIPLAAAALAIVLLSFARPARAADTVETWDVGATDVDFYVGYGGLGRKKRAERMMYGDIMLGYGLIDRLSAYLGQTLMANEHFAAGSGTTYLGIFGTPVDTKHFDLDLFLGVDLGGPGYQEFGLSPKVELNFDLDPNRLSWGAYLRAGFRLHGHNVSDDPDNPRFETFHELCVNLGTYYTLARRHQLLLEFDLTWRTHHAAEDRELQIGGLALGYNVLLSDRFELISQVHFNIPQQGETACVGFMLGFIVTLPSVKK